MALLSCVSHSIVDEDIVFEKDVEAGEPYTSHCKRSTPSEEATGSNQKGHESPLEHG